MNTLNVTIEDAKAASAAIVKYLKPRSVVLFGSVAREGRGSDLDLLVVTDEASNQSENGDLLLHRCLRRYHKRFPIDSFIVPLAKLNAGFRRGSPFLHMIAREGRTLYMRDAIREWLGEAGDEFDMAAYLLKGRFFKGACYHAQQALEKAIMAQLLAKGWDLEKTHSIERLVAICRDFKIKIDLSDSDIVFMDSIYRGRYPIDRGLLPLGEPEEGDAARAVEIATRILPPRKTLILKTCPPQ